MRAVLRLSINALAGRRRRTTLLILAVALSTALVAAIACAMASMNASIEQRVARTVGVADLQVRHVAKDRIDASVLELVRARPEVELAVPRTREPLWITNPATGARSAGTIEGVDLELDARMYPADPTEGRRPQTPDEIVLRDRATKTLGVGIGDEVVVGEGDHAVRVRIVGVVMTPALDIFDKPAGEAAIETVRHASGSGDQVRSIGVVVRKGFDPKSVAEALAPLMPSDVMVRETERVTGRIDSLMRIHQLMFYFASVLGFAGAAVIVLTGLTTAVLERQRELAVVRCIGGTRRQLAGAQLVVGAFIGVMGACVGVPLGVFLAWIITVVFPSRMPAGLQIWPSWLVWSFAGAVVSGIAGAAWSAVRASRARPIGAMTSRSRPVTRRGIAATMAIGVGLVVVQLLLINGVDDPEHLFPVHPFIGLPMLAVGWFLLGVPAVWMVGTVGGPVIAHALRVPSRMIVGSVRASVYRNGFTAGALMVGLGMMTTVYTNGSALLRDWIDAIKFPDAFVNGVFVGITPDMRHRIEGLDFVDRTCAITVMKIDSPAFGLERVMRPKTNFIAFEPEVFFDMTRLHWVAGDPDYAKRRLAEGGAVVVSQEFLVHRTEYGVGSKYPIDFNGRHMEFEIVGAVSSPGLDLVSKYFNMEEDFSENALHAVFGSRADLKKYFGTDAIHLLQIELRGKISDEEAVAQMRAAAGSPGLYFGSARSIKEGVYYIGRSMMTIASVVAFGAMVIGSMGVVNVVVAGIDARRFEFGVVRAVGASGPTVARIVIAEVVLIAISACILGLGMGMQSSWSAIRMYALIGGIEVRLIPPVVPLLGACALLIAITVGSVLPMVVSIARKHPRMLLASTRG